MTEKEMLAQLQQAWAEFKSSNDERLKAIENKKPDPLLEEKVNKVSAEIDRLQDQLRATNENVAAIGLSGGANGADAESLRAFAQIAGDDATPENYRNYVSGMNAYLRRGADKAGVQVMAAMQVGSDPNGGYTVTPDMSGRIVKKVYETSPMRQLASVITIGTDALEGFNDLDEASSGWVGETQERPETGTPELGKWTIPVHEIYAQPSATQKLLDDSMFNIEKWLSDKVSEKFTREENTGFVVGNGVLKPRGILAYPTAATADATRPWGTVEHVNTGASGAFASGVAAGDNLISLVFTLKSAYRQNANFLMARTTVAAVRKLKDGEGRYLWQPNFEARQGGLLLGYPIVEAEDMPAMASNSLSIAFGDLREAYTIVDRTGIRVLRDPFTTKGRVKFYTTKRVGGGMVNFEALKLLRFGS